MINRVRFANPALGQLNRKMDISLSPFGPDAERDGQTGSSLLILHSQAESGTYSRDFSRLTRRCPFIISLYAIWSVPSLSGHAIAYRGHSLPRVRRHKVSCPQGSFSNGCYICISFPTPTNGLKPRLDNNSWKRVTFFVGERRFPLSRQGTTPGPQESPSDKHTVDNVPSRGSNGVV